MCICKVSLCGESEELLKFRPVRGKSHLNYLKNYFSLSVYVWQLKIKILVSQQLVDQFCIESVVFIFRWKCQCSEHPLH